MEGRVANPEPGTVRVVIVETDPDMEIVGEADSGSEAIDSVRRLAPDVVLLDVELPEVNGIQIVRDYGVERFPATVFIADHERSAAEAFQVNALDYLVTPLTGRRFHTTLDRVRRHLRRDRFQDLSERFEARLDPARFARIHRSAIVNLDRFVGVLCSAGSQSVMLKDGTLIPMCRSQNLRVFELAGE